MGGELQFDDETQYTSPVLLGQSETPKLVAWLKKVGIVSNEKKAGNVLFTIILICTVLGIAIPFWILNDNKIDINSGEYIIVDEDEILNPNKR